MKDKSELSNSEVGFYAPEPYFYCRAPVATYYLRRKYSSTLDADVPTAATAARS